MLIVALIGCGVLLVGANIIASTRMGVGGAGMFALVGFFIVPCFMFFSPAIMLNGVLLAVVSAACSITKAQVKTFRWYSLAASVVALLCTSGMALSEMQHAAQVRDKYPFESLAERLAYETTQREVSSGDTLGTLPAAVPTNKDTDVRLAEVEDRIRDFGWRRTRSLELVHANSVERFVNSPGFGVGRRITFGEYWIEQLEPPAPIPLSPPDCPAPTSPADALDLAQLETSPPSGANSIAEPQLWDTHLESAVDFVNADGFGLIRERQRVAGFQSHGFRRLPKLRAEAEQANHVVWLTVRLELVSLLKHATPRVYVSQNLPRMEELRDAPTREPTAFELEAIAKLQRGEDLAIDQRPQQIVMVGSLRATKQCLACHNVERGQLLGAFSYEFLQIPLSPAGPRQSSFPRLLNSQTHANPMQSGRSGTRTPTPFGTRT